MARVVASAGAVVPVAAAAASRVNASAMASAPVIWTFLGYPYEAASMIAALSGCLAARWWIGAGQQIRKEHRWTLDIPVSVMAHAFTFVLVLAQRPAPLTGLMIGAGAGILGEGIFKIAERSMSKAMAVLGDPPADPPQPTSPQPSRRPDPPADLPPKGPTA